VIKYQAVLAAPNLCISPVDGSPIPAYGYAKVGDISPGYVVQDGDALDYSVFIDKASTLNSGAVDLFPIDNGAGGGTLRDSGAVDQYGQYAHPGTDYSHEPGFQRGQWFQRKIALTDGPAGQLFAGATLHAWIVAFDEHDFSHQQDNCPIDVHNPNVIFYIRDVNIVDKSGNIKVALYNGEPTLPGGRTSATASFDTGGYDPPPDAVTSVSVRIATDPSVPVPQKPVVTGYGAINPHGAPLSGAPASTPILVLGSNFGSTGTVTFNGIPAAVVSWSPTEIETIVPEAPSYPFQGPVTVTSNGQTGSGPPFTITSAPPTPPASPPSITVGEAVAHGSGIELLPDEPSSATVTNLIGVGPDGSLYLLDWAGTSLLRVPPTPGAPATVLVDPPSATADGVGIARLLRARVSPSGAVGLEALRADNHQGFYRLANGSLTLLGLLLDPRGDRELAIGDAGQTAYVANVDPTNPASPLALFQAGNGAPVELLRQGQVVVNGATVTGFSDLTGNGKGDLAVRIALNGSPNQAVLKFTRAGAQILAKSGDAVARGSGSGATGVLTEQRRPLIGPDDSVVFLGAGSDFVNFYVARPGRPLAALLAVPGTDLSIVEPVPPSPPSGPSAGHRFDYEIAANGTIALQAALSNPADSTLLISLAGSATPVVAGLRPIEPILAPVFASDGTLFFLAEDQTRPTDREGRLQGGLYRLRLGAAAPERVAMPGDHIPGWSSDTRLLALTQRPVVAGNSLFFGAVFGGPESYPVPTAALFQVPLTGTLADNGVPVVPEGYPVADAGRVALLRELSYRADGTLAAYGLMPGAGPMVAPAPPPAQTASLFRIEAAPPPSGIVPLVADGDPLGGGELRCVVPPLVAVGTDRELFGARTSQTQLPDHEGLFTVSAATKELVARNRDPVPDRTGAFFNGFADTRFADTQGLPDKRLFTLSPSSVGPNGQLVFKAEVDRGGAPAGGQLPLFGIFQWSSGGMPSTIGLSDDPFAPGDRLPYVIDNWAAGPSGLSFLLVRSDGGKGPGRLLVSGASPKPAAALGPGTPVTGGTPLTDLTGFVLNRGNTLFVTGATAGGAGVFRDMAGSLVPLALQGMPVPAFSDGTPTAGYTFAGSFQLLPSTARGAKLLFRAMVQKPGGAARLGEFEWSADAGLQSRSIVGVEVTGERTLAADMLGDTTLELQNGNGTAVSAYLSDQGGWVIVRSRVSGGNVVSETIAQDAKGTDPNGRRFVVLDAGPLLDQEGLPPHSGPVFTLNDAGEVALLASDGKKWGIYSISP
jgi:hypothetical protein